MKNRPKISNKTKVLVGLVTIFIVQNFAQPTFADYSQEDLDKKIEELIYKPQIVFEMGRYALESLREKVKLEGSVEQLNQIDLALEKSFYPPKQLINVWF